MRHVLSLFYSSTHRAALALSPLSSSSSSVVIRGKHKESVVHKHAAPILKLGPNPVVRPKTVMVGVDSSADAHHAFHVAVGFLRPGLDQLLVVTVPPAIQTDPLFFGGMAPAVMDVYQRSIEHACQSIVKRYSTECERLGLPRNLYEVIITRPCIEIAEGLCETVDERKVDYVVLGQHGLGRRGRQVMHTESNALDNLAIVGRRMFGLGGTSEWMTRHCRAHVVIVRPSHPDVDPVAAADAADADASRKNRRAATAVHDDDSAW